MFGLANGDPVTVAPRMGSEFRNIYSRQYHNAISRSLPAWGARIEIPQLQRPLQPPPVAPRMGSEDRNDAYVTSAEDELRVAPRMGSEDRNLYSKLGRRYNDESLPAWGARIEMALSVPGRRQLQRRSPHGERG